VDLPGTGGSTASVPLSTRAWASDLADVIEKVFGEPAVIVGHSLGTILALELWRARADLVRAMVFVGGLPAPRLPIRDRLRSRAEAIAARGMAGWGAQVAAGVFSVETMARSPETVALFARLFEAQSAQSYLSCLDVLVGADASDVAPTVSVPCASISGTEDQYAPPDDVTAFVSRLPPGTPQLLLPDVGHLPFLEAPDAFAEALEDVLGELTSGA
jgi:pimeloyl-ACP methyl ester carboxylesterase